MSSDPGSTGAESGKLIVISGPSGAGKTSICNALLTKLPNTIWSVSATTRPMRRGEESGTSYEFLSESEFERRLAAGEFLESAVYVGNRYGTPRQPVEEAIRRGQIVIMEIDVQGGMQVAVAMPDSIRVFVLPPDLDSLRARLEGRNTEAEEQLAKRLEKADGEIAVARDSKAYQHFVINDDLDATIRQVMEIIQKETSLT